MSIALSQPVKPPVASNFDEITKIIGTPESIIEECFAIDLEAKERVFDYGHKLPLVRKIFVPPVEQRSTSYCQLMNNANHPQDDAILIDDNNKVFVVADGVTREPPGFKEENKAAAIVATAFVRLFHYYYLDSQFRGDCIDISISRAFVLANQKIASINERLGLGDDFGEKCKAACAASLIVKVGDIVRSAYIADCGVRNTESSGRPNFASRLQTKESEEARVKKHPDDLAGQLIFHRKNANREIRNNIEKHPLSYGIINGDPSAINFLHISMVVTKGTMLLYSDGALEVFGGRKKFLEADISPMASAEDIVLTELGEGTQDDDVSLVKPCLY